MSEVSQCLGQIAVCHRYFENHLCKWDSRALAKGPYLKALSFMFNEQEINTTGPIVLLEGSIT